MNVKRILPPTMLLLSLGLMFLLHFTYPILSIIHFPLSLLGIPLALVGALLSIRGSTQFGQKKTTVMTFDIPEVLVTEGLYQYSRNPMYLGFGVLIIGIWMLLGNLSSAFITLVYITLLDRYYIRFEEEVLYKKFGKAYQEYKTNVRKWI